MPSAELTRHCHADPPFTIDLPPDVELFSVPGVPLIARDPTGGSGSPFRANLTVAVDALEPAMDPPVELESLPSWRLIDRAEDSVGGLPAERLLATYVLDAQDGVDLGRPVSVTLEQWRLEHAGRAWVVSCSCDTLEYALAARTWAVCAESLRPGATA
jgi:hypothetical protein